MIHQRGETTANSRLMPTPAVPVQRPPYDAGPLDEATLVARLRGGDGQAFTALYQRHAATLHRMARRHTPNASVAEDLVQETWLAVLEGIQRFEGRSSFRTWICTILVYTAQRQAERARREEPFCDAFPDRWHNGTGVVHRLDQLIASDPGRALMAGPEEPAAAALGREGHAVLRRLIDTLPPRQAAVIRLIDVEGWSSEEACQRLGLTAPNLRLLLHRARLGVRTSWLAT